MCTKIFTVFLTLQLCCILVKCRTNEDVIKDFEPIYQQLHEEFNKIQNYTQEKIEPLEQIIGSEVQEMRNLTIAYLQSLQEIVQKNTTEYLELTGMVNRPNLTKPCFDKLHEENRTILFTFNAQEKVCLRTVTVKSDYYRYKYLTVLDNFKKEHVILDETKEECVKLSTPLETQTCVISYLYEFYMPYMKKLQETMEQFIFNTTLSLVKIVIIDYGVCDRIIREEVKQNFESAVMDFKLCVWFAIP